MKQFVDKYLNFAISKKLLVFLISCVAMFTGHVSGEEFILVSSIYIGTQGAIDAIKEHYKK